MNDRWPRWRAGAERALAWSVREAPVARDFAVALGRRLWQDEVLVRAASLTFTTLLAIVPLIVLVFGVLSSFGAFRDQLNAMSAALIHQLIPVSPETVRRYLGEFGKHAANLTVLGLGWVIGLVAVILFEVDSALNHIWRSHGHRSLLFTIAGYWALVTLGPLLLGVGFTVTSYLIAKFQELASFSQFLFWAGLWVLQIAAEVAGFALLFLVVPRAVVRVRHAVLGGFATTVLFEFAKHAFASYVLHVHNYQLIYGGLAVIPLFMLWVYIIWVIVLVGAELTYCLAARCHRVNLSDARAARSPRLALRLLGHLQDAHASGRGLGVNELTTLEPYYSTAQIQAMLAQLEALRLAGLLAGGREWVLGRDLGATSLRELWHAADLSLQPCWPGGVPGDPWDRALARVLEAAAAGAGEALRVPLASLLRAPSPVREAPRPAPSDGARAG